MILVLLGAGVAHGAEVPVRLPEGEDPEAWVYALDLVGLEPVSAPVSAPSVKLSVVDDATWMLIVVDRAGTERRTPIAAPTTPSDREGVAFLANSLLEEASVAKVAAPAPAQPRPPPRPAPPLPPAELEPSQAKLLRPAELGVGVAVGVPTGLAAKASLGFLGVDLAAGSALPGPAGHVTPLVQVTAPTWGRVRLGAHTGVGACLRQRVAGLSVRAGLRFPVGADLRIERTPIDLFAEGALVVLSGPWLPPAVEGVGGIRWTPRLGDRSDREATQEER